MTIDDRTYVRVHDGLDEHPKVEPLSDAAFRLLLTSWFYCSRNRTDGKIRDVVWKRRGTPKTRRELTDAGLVEQHDGHVQMHDYLQHQRSAQEIDLLKSVRGDNGSYGNHVRWHVVRRKPKKDCAHCLAEPDGDRKPIAKAIANGSQTDRKVIASTETEAETQELSTDRGGSHVSSESPTPPLLGRCSDHQYDVVPPKCGACKDARLAAELERNRQPLRLVSDTKRCLVHDLSYVERCNGCEADRKGRKETA